MDPTDVLADAVQRPLDAADRVLRDISHETLHARPAGRGSSIAWLVWHAARQMDAQLAGLSGTDQVWSLGGWSERLGIPRGPRAIGFGDTPDDVAALRVNDAGLLGDYFRAVVDAFVTYLAGLSASGLDEVVDTSWDPPVTRGVRLVSLIDDAVAHVGQAAYARGLVEGWTIGY
ncbi:MAG: DUF664 domain-containing protein [Propionicimonas sp.]